MSKIKVWTDALRSKKYPKAEGLLRDIGGEEEKFCALGVLCELYRREHPLSHWDNYQFVSDTDESDTRPPDEVLEWAGVPKGEVNVVMEMNDNEQRSFEYIAEYLEAQYVK